VENRCDVPFESSTGIEIAAGETDGNALAIAVQMIITKYIYVYTNT
jgi:hypothetical protein